MSPTHPSRSEYDIVAIYSATDLPARSKVATEDGVKSAEYVLTPTRIEEGKYVVKVTRKGKDIYQVDGKRLFIETRYCYEYASRDEVILSVESSYGYTIGKIKF